MNNKLLKLLVTPMAALALACPQQPKEGSEDPNAGDGTVAGAGPTEGATGSTTGAGGDTDPSDGTTLTGEGSALADSRVELAAMINEATAAGQHIGGIEVRLIDAPVDADAVWVTFCGVHVQALAGEAVDPTAAESGQTEATTEAEDASDEGDETMTAFAELDGDQRVPSGHAEERDDDENGADESDEAAAREDESDNKAHDSDALDSHWVVVSDTCTSLDLLTLQGGLFESMGMAALPVGSYGQIRFMLTDAWVVVDGEQHAMTVPSGTQSGLKVNGGFEISEGVVTTLTVDFDAAKSVFQTGNGEYKMKPVIFLADLDRSEARSEREDSSKTDVEKGGAREQSDEAGQKQDGGRAVDAARAPAADAGTAADQERGDAGHEAADERGVDEQIETDEPEEAEHEGKGKEALDAGKAMGSNAKAA